MPQQGGLLDICKLAPPVLSSVGVYQGLEETEEEMPSLLALLELLADLELNEERNEMGNLLG